MTDEPAAAPETTRARLKRVQLVGAALSGLSPLQELDRHQAVADLQESDNRFELVFGASKVGGDAQRGPYVLFLSLHDGRLILDVRDEAEVPLASFGIALGPFRSVIKDYQLLVDSYAMAMEEGREARIQAIDMGRRGLHNEGAELLMRRLEGKVVLEMETARRLFTLVCVLHQRI
jgi:uncharacterized protein (UPF0262 family)